jgi:DNA/RNA endonuclease YhcR with UshA esterase domain
MILAVNRFAAVGLSMLAGSALSISVALANDNQMSTQTINQTSSITAQDLNQNPGTYLGKQVTITGRVDRVLGNGSYVIADGKNTKDPSRRILIFTSASNGNSNANGKQNLKQQAGVAAVTLKEGDSVKLSGKVEEFNVSNEMDTFSPKSDVETINETAATTPVVVVQPGSILRD